MDIQVIAALLIGAAALALGARMARRFNLPEASGLVVALAAVALALAFAPGEWRQSLIAGESSDRVLGFARDIGLTGLFFLAGTRFDSKEAWRARRISLAVAAAGLVLLVAATFLLATFAGLDRYVAAVTAAAIVAASLWLPSELSLSVAETYKRAAAASTSGAAILTGLSMLVVHLYAMFHEVSGRAPSMSAYGVVALYELAKITLFFSAAWFVATRFINRAEGRIPAARMLIGYLLIIALIFALAASTISPFAALAWSFVAGALMTRSHFGRNFGKSYRPVVAAVLLSLTFVPVFLQSHGRTLTNAPLVLALVLGASVCKFSVGWAAAKAAGASGEDAKLIAASTLASGEAGAMFLGFSVTRWMIEGPEYFGVLIFPLLSMIAGPFVWRFVRQDKDAIESGRFLSSLGESDSSSRIRDSRAKPTTKGIAGKRASLAVAIAVTALLSLGPAARAQSASAPAGDDPVSRALKSIEVSVDSRAQAAEVVLAGSKLVNESTAARKRGERNQAKQALEEAERIAGRNEEFNRSALMKELTRLIAEERAALSPDSAGAAPQFSSAKGLAVALPRSVLARFGEHREALGQILRDENVPVELLAVALVESGFNPLAMSPKGARGIWQFMPATAVRYGLTVQRGNDHRTHPEHSTRAAARYLRDLYNRFGDWKFALAAYNAGEDRIQRVIEKTGIRDFDEMARRGYLPAETRNYVPAVLAVWARLSGTNSLTTATARQRDKRRGGAVEALVKPEGSAAPSEAGPNQ